MDESNPSGESVASRFNIEDSRLGIGWASEAGKSDGEHVTSFNPHGKSVDRSCVPSAG